MAKTLEAYPTPVNVRKIKAELMWPEYQPGRFQVIEMLLLTPLI